MTTITDHLVNAITLAVTAHAHAIFFLMLGLVWAGVTVYQSGKR